MTRAEWFACKEPDLMLEALMGRIGRDQLALFVRQCWEHIRPHLEDIPYDYTVVDQYEQLAHQLNDHDAVVYAAEAALKAAGLAPNMREEQARQAEFLRQIVSRID